jgi:hypothetical protein
MSRKPARTWKKGSCHCGAVTFEVRTGPEVELVDCNCSMCHRTGYLHLIVPKSDFRLLTGKRKLTSYTFHTKTAKHMFCSVCGVKPFYVPRSHPDGWSVNFRCLNPKDFASVITIEFDGKNWENNVTKLSPLESA